MLKHLLWRGMVDGIKHYLLVSLPFGRPTKNLTAVNQTGKWNGFFEELPYVGCVRAGFNIKKKDLHCTESVDL